MREIRDFLSVLPYGRENALHQKEILKRSGLSYADFKREVKRHRENWQGGLYIISGRSGYWLTYDTEEIILYMKTRLQDGRTRQKTVQAIEKTINIDLWENRLRGAVRGIERKYRCVHEKKK